MGNVCYNNYYRKHTERVVIVRDGAGGARAVGGVGGRGYASRSLSLYLSLYVTTPEQQCDPFLPFGIA